MRGNRNAVDIGHINLALRKAKLQGLKRIGPIVFDMVETLFRGVGDNVTVSNQGSA
jgi:hypothetical protein